MSEQIGSQQELEEEIADLDEKSKVGDLEAASVRNSVTEETLRLYGAALRGVAYHVLCLVEAH
ncbi:hypothetical protein J1614_004853 [Plenodomus biglobosus]|nr:hypothetical protein J1614_004853 [Plenodomus biglobosus]